MLMQKAFQGWFKYLDIIRYPWYEGEESIEHLDVKVVGSFFGK
jgi:hypothetical protein